MSFYHNYITNIIVILKVISILILSLILSKKHRKTQIFILTLLFIIYMIKKCSNITTFTTIF
jgi:hypothetical protein